MRFASQEEFEAFVEKLCTDNPGLEVTRPLPDYRRLDSFWFPEDEVVASYKDVCVFADGDIDLVYIGKDPTDPDEQENAPFLNGDCVNPDDAESAELTDEDIMDDKRFSWKNNNWFEYEREGTPSSYYDVDYTFDEAIEGVLAIAGEPLPTFD